MNNEIIDIISVGIMLFVIIGGVLVYAIQVAEEMKNNRLKTKKEIELLDVEILEVKNRIKK